VAVVKIVGLLQIFPSVLGKAMAFDNHAWVNFIYAQLFQLMMTTSVQLTMFAHMTSSPAVWTLILN
jgi:hypothetical protein